jgi:hypothetical protein
MRILTAIKTAMSKVALVVLSIAITLVLLEFAVRLFFPQPLNHYNFTLIQAEGGGEMVLGSNMSAVEQRTRGSGPYVPKLSTHFGGVPVTINSHGWRDDEYSLKKPEGVSRIMVVGDSVTFGYGVRLEEMFAKVLERGLNSQGLGRFEVISMGGAGGNTYSQSRIIKENVAIYDPDLVILVFNLNDILPKIFGKKTARSTDGDRSISRSISRTSLDVRRTLDTKFRSRSHLYFLVRERMKVWLRPFGIASPAMVPLAAFDMESNSGRAAWRDTSGALLEIAHQLDSDKVKFLLAVLPVDMQLSPEIADLYRRDYGFVFDDSLVNGLPQKIIADFARGHGIACVDLLPSFRKDPHEQTFFRIYGGSIDWNHPNRLGHKIIGEQLNKAVNTLGADSGLNGKAGRESYPARQKAGERAVTVPILEYDAEFSKDSIRKSPNRGL